MNGKILAITVTWKPLVSQVCRQVDRLLDENVDVLVIDNGSVNSEDLSIGLREYGTRVTLMKLENNFGIAYAQNRGIEIAIQQNFQYVLLMDQDSLPESNMVYKLLEALNELPDAAAIGPNFIDDEHKTRSRFIRLERLKIVKMSSSDSPNLVEVDHLIASGSLIPVQHLSRVGFMDESLFIDYVDIEWALRARSMGFRSYGLFSARMFHTLGDAHLNVLRRKIAVHSPQRYYYMVRNALLLYKRPYISKSWKLVDAFKLAAKLTLLLMLSPGRIKVFKAILYGIFHGFSNKSGKYVLK